MISVINTCQHLFISFEASDKKHKAHLDLKMRPSYASYTHVLHFHLTIDSATCIAQIKISCCTTSKTSKCKLLSDYPKISTDVMFKIRICIDHTIDINFFVKRIVQIKSGMQTIFLTKKYSVMAAVYSLTFYCFKKAKMLIQVVTQQY